jgi:ADP-heptose:LPS heptosyltransferase
VADHGVPIVEPLVLVPSEEERRQAAALVDRLPAGFLAIHPGSGSPSKNWPATRFVELVSRTSGGRQWLLCVGPAEEAITPRLASLPGAVIASGLPPRVLGAVLSRAGVFVGNDSGVSHLAAAWGAPVVALFGPTDPTVWAPVGTVVRTVRAADRALESIDVERVAATALSIRRG